jgi:hypothetical protein
VTLISAPVATDGAELAFFGEETREDVPDDANTDLFVLSGRGRGHGVGLSQRGAEGMARAGFNYIEILQSFYTGVVVREPRRDGQERFLLRVTAAFNRAAPRGGARRVAYDGIGQKHRRARASVLF